MIPEEKSRLFDILRNRDLASTAIAMLRQPCEGEKAKEHARVIALLTRSAIRDTLAVIADYYEEMGYAWTAQALRGGENPLEFDYLLATLALASVLDEEKKPAEIASGAGLLVAPRRTFTHRRDLEELRIQGRREIGSVTYAGRLLYPDDTPIEWSIEGGLAYVRVERVDSQFTPLRSGDGGPIVIDVRLRDRSFAFERRQEVFGEALAGPTRWRVNGLLLSFTQEEIRTP